MVDPPYFKKPEHCDLTQYNEGQNAHIMRFYALSSFYIIDGYKNTEIFPILIMMEIHTSTHLSLCLLTRVSNDFFFSLSGWLSSHKKFQLTIKGKLRTHDYHDRWDILTHVLALSIPNLRFHNTHVICVTWFMLLTCLGDTYSHKGGDCRVAILIDKILYWKLNLWSTLYTFVDVNQQFHDLHNQITKPIATHVLNDQIHSAI